MIGTIIFVGVTVVIGTIGVVCARACSTPEYRKIEDEKTKREQKYFWTSRF